MQNDFNLSAFMLYLILMKKETKLTIVKVVHTIIWVCFNVVIFYMLYAAIANKLDIYMLIGYCLLFAEGVILLICNFFCPLTIIARRYSDSANENFDIYLPEWLAKYNKRIYTSIVLVIIIITVYRLLVN